ATYPQPFVSSAGVADVAVIVGSGAAAEDIIASNDIVASLVVPTGSGTTTSVSGGDSKALPVGSSLNDNSYGWSTAIRQSRVPTLQDDSISIAIGDVSDEYNFHEEIVFNNGIAVRTGLNVSNPHEDYGEKPFLQIDQNSITYRYVFDEAVKSGNYLANATTDDSVTLAILGKDIEITSATATSLTANVGEKFTLSEGESKDVDGKTLTLVQVGSQNDIYVDIDGVKDYIASGNSKTIGGLRVKNYNAIYTTSSGGTNIATIIAGEKTSKTYNSADEFVGQDEYDPDWVWELSNLDGQGDNGKPKINVTWDQSWTGYDEVIFEGDSLSLPNNYITIKFDSLTETTFAEYVIKNARTRLYDSSGLETGAGTNTVTQEVLLLEALDGENNGFKLSGGEETDKIYIAATNLTATGYNNFSIYWYDKDASAGQNNPKLYATTGNNTDVLQHTVIAQYKDANFNIDIVPASPYAISSQQLRIEIGRGERQYINLTTNSTSLGFDYGFGTKDGDAIVSDVVSGGESPFKQIGTWTANTLTVDGLKIYDPNNYGDSNEFRFAIPRDEGLDFKANIQVYGEGATISRTGTQVTRAPIGVSFLDTEITSVQGKNIIAIGGSGINKVSAKILGLEFPTYGTSQAWQDATMVTGEGQAVVKIVDSPYTDGKVAMIVAGWSAVDTRRAGKAVAQNVPALSGTEALLSTVSSTVTKL
ncbi:MAG: hypothetical protein KJ767_01825, partial [Nanoarchaeota archaeon]|nr:hypothetical protein [Nanoarchaeota archaeon]